MKTILSLVCTLLTLLCQPVSSQAMFDGDAPQQFNSMTEMADAMAREMRSDYPGRKLYLDREDIRNELNGATAPFSGMLANELERALSRHGFGFEERNIDQADFAVKVSYRPDQQKVTVYLKLKDIKSGSSYRNLKGSYWIGLDKLPSDSFSDSLDNRIGRLAAKIAAGWRRSNTLQVYVNPVVETRKKYSSPFSDYVTLKLKTILSAEPSIKVIEEKPSRQKLALTRSISNIKAPIATGDASIAGADAILDGSYLRGSQSVSLAFSLKELSGRVISGAADSIPLELVQYSTANDAAETLSQIADTEHEQGGDMVRISTVKGGAYQVFHEGDLVSFRLLVKRPLYLYVYDINPKGEVSLLYPKAGEAETPKLPGIIHILPEETDSWTIRVEPPFGTDAVKVFASNRKLPLPRISEQVASRSFEGTTRSLQRIDNVRQDLARQKTINGKDLVDYYKGIAAKTGAPLYESTVYIETRAK